MFSEDDSPAIPIAKQGSEDRKQLRTNGLISNVRGQKGESPPQKRSLRKSSHTVNSSNKNVDRVNRDQESCQANDRNRQQTSQQESASAYNRPAAQNEAIEAKKERKNRRERGEKERPTS